MKATVWMLLALLAAVMMMAACPRTTEANGGEGNQIDNSSAAPATEGITETAPPADESEALTVGEDPAAEEKAVEMTAEEPVEEGAAAEESTPSEEGNGLPIVVFETTKGDIVMEIHPEWSPKGAEHFLELVEAGFYNGAPWFRVVDSFVAQCGVAADPAMNEQWSERTIQDEPVVQGNQRGYVAFGKSMMPNSRSTHIFINLVDNSRGLDGQGFSCFAKVIEGMDVADSLVRVEYGDQAGLASPGGLEKFKTMYPNADYINNAIVKYAEAPAE